MSRVMGGLLDQMKEDPAKVHRLAEAEQGIDALGLAEGRPSACLLQWAEFPLGWMSTNGCVFEPVWCQIPLTTCDVTVCPMQTGSDCCCCCCGATCALVAPHWLAEVAGMTSLPPRCDECAFSACTSTVMRWPL